MRALWAAEEIPDGSKGGGHIRQSYLFRALANSVPADLLLVGELHDDEVRAAAHVVLEQPRPATVELRNRTLRRALNIANAAISPVPYELSRLTPVRRAVARELAERANDYDLVIVVHETLATALPRRRRGTWVVQFDHVLSEMYRQRAAAASGRQRWLHENDAHKAERLEQAAIGAWDSVVVCSAEDEALLGLTGSPRSIVAPNGADVSRVPTPLPPSPRILLPGTLCFDPNIDGAIWFCDQVLPAVLERRPDATLDIVGREPVPAVLDLAARPGVAVYGDVPSMRPWFDRARVVIVPLRVGTGTRVKALEGMAAGRAVVGTSIGLEGLGLADGRGARITDDPVAMADAIVELLDDDERAGSLAREGRAVVESRFSWSRIGEDYVAALLALTRTVTARAPAR